MTDSVPHHQDVPLRGLLPCTCVTERRKRRANPSEVILFRQRSEASCESSTIIKSQRHLGLIYVLHRSQENNAVQENLLGEKNNLSTKSSQEAKALQSTKRKLCAMGISHFHHPLVNCGYPRLPGKLSHRLPSEALRRQGRKTFVQSRLDLLIWWHWVITHSQSLLDLLPLPSLDMLSNPTSLILSDQRAKNVLHSPRNRRTQSRFLGLVLWTCLSTKPVFQFHFCRCEKAPWEKRNLWKKGVHFSSQFQVPVHYGGTKAGTSHSYSQHI